jgi:hypothetical protein
MQRHARERGAALILLIGITAALAILTAVLVMALGNQQGATAGERERKDSLYYAEGALDSAVQVAKTKTFPTTLSGSSGWLTQQDIQDALDAAGFPAGAVLNHFWVYDNLTPVVTTTAYDSNLDGLMWLDIQMTYQGKTTRLRCLMSQTTQNVVKSFPKAVVYSDTGIKLDNSSDVYAVDTDGVTPYNPASHAGAYSTTIMAGGSKNPAAGAQDFASNAGADLAAPSSTAQSVNINVNGAVTGHSYAGTVIGGVGLLSDYFDQAAQADLGDESQIGQSHAAAPTAPAAPPTPTPTPAATFSAVEKTDLANTTTPTPFTVTSGRKNVTTPSPNLSITRTNPRTYNFTDLYIRGNLSLTGPVTLNVSGYLRVDGTLTINNNTATACTDTFSGPVYVVSTSASSVQGPVTVSAGSSFFVGGPFTIKNPTTTAGLLYASNTLAVTGNAGVSATTLYSGGALSISGATSPITDQFGSVYLASTSAGSVAGTVTLNATSSLYAAGPLTLSNTATTTGLLYADAAYSSTTPALSITGNTTVKSTALVVSLGDFTISGATSAVTDQFGPIWAGGPSSKSTWSGTASVKTTYYNNATAAPGPMWITIIARSGTYNDVYGDVWVTGNAGTGNVACKFDGPTTGTACTVMCPLLATTEKTEIRGKVNFGSMTNPMVYYMMCDNDSLYSNTCLIGDSANSQPYLGTFYGLMVVMEACIKFYSTNASVPCVVGAVFEGTPYKSGSSDSQYDITLSGSASIAYDQAILDAVTNTAITTLTTTTQIVTGSWQQLPLI